MEEGTKLILESTKKNTLIKTTLLFFTITILAILLMQKKTVMFNEVIIDNVELNNLTTSRTFATQDLFNSIEFDEFPLIIDKFNHHVYFSISSIMGQPFQFNPSVKVRSNERVDISFSNDDISWTSIAENKQIPFIIYSKTEYQILYLVITTLPLVEIELNEESGDPDKPIPPSETFGKITVIDNQTLSPALNRYFKSDIEIHLRGNSSRTYPQNSYRLSLIYKSQGLNIRKNNTSLLGMEWDDDWILYAPFNDPEKLRNALSTNLWWEWGAKNNKFGMSNGSQAKFIELFIDGRYWGIYVLMKPITAKKLLITNHPEPTKSEYYYRTISWEETTHEMFLNYSDELPVYRVGKFELRYPNEPAPGYEKWAPLDRLNQVMQSNYEQFSEEIFTLANEQSSIDVWLFVTTVLGFDNNGNNLTYVAKMDGEDYIFYFSPWDLDQTWGMLWTGDLPFLTAISRDPDDPFIMRMICDRFVENNSNEIINKIQSRYSEIRSTILSDGNMDQLLNIYEKNIFGSGAYLRNQERWPEAAYADNMTNFKDFVFQRLNYMDGYVESLSANMEH